MNPVAFGLILLGSLVQILGVVFFAVLGEDVQMLPLIVAVSLGSAVEAAGVLMIIRRRA